MRRQEQIHIERSLHREGWLKGVLLLGAMVLVAKLVMLETVGSAKLQAEAKDRHVRTLDMLPVRGAIEDRNGHLLAVSTPSDTIWADPGVFCPWLLRESDSKVMDQLGKLLSLRKTQLHHTCSKWDDKGGKAVSGFMYLKRQQNPALAEQVKAMGLPGVYLRREYKRFYPSGPASAHMIGFVDIDSQGQEGLEKLLDARLRGVAGEKTVLRDKRGRFVEFVEQTRKVVNAAPVRLSLDSRLQYLATGYLEAAVREHQADSGSVVMIRIPTGEVLTVVDSPQFNPNDRSSLTPSRFRNRAFTDLQEPGSTIKPFTIAAALESGRYTPGTWIETGKGPMPIRGGPIRDTRSHGTITVSDVVMVSSNIGSAKIALDLGPQALYQMFSGLGFGQKVGLGVPEAEGVLKLRDKRIDLANQSFGYGMSATALQVARAYTALATDGRVLPLRFEPGEQLPEGRRVFSAETAAEVRKMLERVTSDDGTAWRARVPRYRVGGKTGTTHKLVNGAYADDRYVSWFVGMAPMSRPEFVLAVTLDNPKGERYYGGVVAAPVFSKLMADALRLFNVVPDGGEQLEVRHEKPSPVSAPRGDGA